MKIEIKLNKLEKFIKDVPNLQNQEVRIGFLGEEKNTRSGGELTNADLAAIHHFGSVSKKLPPRSPFVGFQMEEKTSIISNIIGKSLESSVKKNTINKSDVTQALKKGGLAGENLIDEAFQTGGFGSWKPINPKTAKAKGNKKILIATDQLHKSRVSKVINK